MPTEHGVRAILLLSTLGSLAVLGLSIWPGILNDLVLMLILTFIVLLPLSGFLFALIVLILAKRHRQGSALPNPKRDIAATLIVTSVTLALLWFYVPRRLAFLFSRSAFESLAQSAPPPGIAPVNARLGIYWVDDYAGDARGTVFFRVHSGFGGIGPDVMSYGFVRQPSSVSTPFGAASYRYFHIVDDWYWFRVSDDWY